VDIVSATRGAPDVQLAASSRAALSLMKASRALAVGEGMEFVAPDHVRELAEDVVAHRLVLEPQAKYAGLTGRKVVADILERIDAPH
jgi:MoxR-like ATPase